MVGHKIYHNENKIISVYYYGSEEHEILQTGGIHGAVLPSCRFLYNRAF